MPFLPDERSTDKLLKLLATDLMRHFNADDLRRLGWPQFRDHDHPKTLVSTHLAAEAFIYLGFDANGAWRRSTDLIIAVLAFMKQYHDDRPTESDLNRLKGMIETEPPNKDAVRHWFEAVYPPDAIP